MRIRFHRFSRKNYFYDRIAWIWAQIFVFEQTFREIYFPQLLSRRAGLCSVNDTISGKLPGKRARENLVRTLSLLINDGSSSSFPTPSSCASFNGLPSQPHSPY